MQPVNHDLADAGNENLAGRKVQRSAVLHQNIIAPGAEMIQTLLQQAFVIRTGKTHPRIIWVTGPSGEELLCFFSAAEEYLVTEGLDIMLTGLFCGEAVELSNIFQGSSLEGFGQCPLQSDFKYRKSAEMGVISSGFVVDQTDTNHRDRRSKGAVLRRYLKALLP